MRIRAASAVVALVVATTVAAGTLPAADPAEAAGPRAVTISTDWPMYEHDPLHSSATGDPAITAAKVPRLAASWSFTPPGATQPKQPPHIFRASPIVAGGRVFIGSNTGVLYALSTTTGKVVWQKLLDYGISLHCGAQGVGASVTVAPDPRTGVSTVYAAGAHYLYALDAATGAQRWKVPVGSSAPDAAAWYYNWSSPTVAGGRIFMGITSSCTDFHVRAGEQSFDQRTGKLLNTYYDMPAGSFGGSIWSTAATDGKSVWVTTGDPAVKSPSVGDSYSVVRLDAATLKKLDRWRTANTPAQDTDFGSSPTLWTTKLGGRDVRLIGACNKNGNFYAWRSDNLAAGPVWQRMVGQSFTKPYSFCITSASYDKPRQRLLIASNTTTVAGKVVRGAIRAVDPATGRYLWERPLDCGPLGSPTVNSVTGLVAVSTYTCPTGVTPSVQIYDTSTGRLIRRIATVGPVFAQPVFAAGRLFIAQGGSRASGGSALTSYVVR